jgi:putative sterol carrier protein
MGNPTKDQVKAFYALTAERVLDAYSKIDEKEWDKKASDHWTAKGHLAYTVGTLEEEHLPVTRAAVSGEVVSLPGFTKRDEEPAFRRAVTEKLSGLPATELITRLRAAYDEHARILDGLSETDLERKATNPGWDREGTVRDLFVSAYLLLVNQYQAIRRVAKKKVQHWMEGIPPERVHYHVDRLLHYMPLILNRDRADDMNSTYQFTMEGAGGGQWNMRIADGRADTADGVADPYDCEIKTKPALWMDLASGDLSAPIAIMTRKVKLGGNPALAMKLSGLFGSTD